MTTTNKAKRIQKLDRLTEAGYQAHERGEPCAAPCTNSQERAAWEIGWRAARRAKSLCIGKVSQ